MRRLLLFAALLSLVGLTTAFAASFSVQSEDIKSFSSPVSISVPTTTSTTAASTTTTTTPPTVFTKYYLSGMPGTLPGPLNPLPESDQNNVQAKPIAPGTGTVQSQTLAVRYHSWQIAAPTGGLSLSGYLKLVVTQVGTPGTLRAAVFDCPADAGVTSLTCTRFAGDSDGVEAGNVTTVSFGQVSRVIPAGRILRVQLMNASLKDWSVQWGYKQNRESRLEVTAQP